MVHTALTKTLAVIGNPIEHSMSPLIHGAAIAETRVDFSYVAFRVPDAAEAVRAMRSLGIRGFSVTIPHKETVIPHLDRLDETARACGSVNTIVNDDGVLTGYTTDGPGAVAALRAAGAEPAGKNILIVGTGGAARAISFSLLNAGASKIAFQAALPEQAARLARDLDAVRSGVIEKELRGPVDLLVNASPVGMHPKTDELPVEPTLLKKGMAVFDIVYNPIRTRLLKEAEKLGCVTIDGTGMFAEQAALQFELFTGRPAPRELMRRTVYDALVSRQG